MDYIAINDLKSSLFEVFSAGYEAGYSGDDDLAKAYDKYFTKILDAWRAYNEQYR